MQAPTLAISGDALDADEIVRIAKRYGVPVVDRAPLAQALSGLETGATIPEVLYRAVAVVLAELEARAKRLF
jgi:type III secretion system FlhB-like substrate exporter